VGHNYPTPAGDHAHIVHSVTRGGAYTNAVNRVTESASRIDARRGSSGEPVLTNTDPSVSTIRGAIYDAFREGKEHMSSWIGSSVRRCQGSKEGNKSTATVNSFYRSHELILHQRIEGGRFKDVGKLHGPEYEIMIGLAPSRTEPVAAKRLL